jgi:hypothetical protein
MKSFLEAIRTRLFRCNLQPHSLSAVKRRRATQFRARFETLEDRKLMAGLGLTATFYDNVDFTGASVSKVTPTVNYNWGAAAPDATLGADTFSARLEGTIKVPTTGSYNFQTVSDDGVRVWINGQLVINNWTNHSATTNTSSAVSLTAGQTVNVKLEYYDNVGVARVSLAWKTPGQTAYIVIPESQLSPTLSRAAVLNYSARHYSSSRSDSIFAAANLPYVKAAPFDGLVVASYAGTYLMQPTQPSNPDLAKPFAADNTTNDLFDIKDNPQNLGAFNLSKLSGTTLQHNFAIINVHRPGDFFDNAAWTEVAGEVAAFAAVAKAKGFEGIFFDNEDYNLGTNLSLYRWENRTQLTKTPQEYITQARLCGQQFMQAIVGAWPDVKLIAAHGISELSGPDVVAYGVPEADNISAHTAAAFTAGVWQGRGTLGTYIDGGEFGYETEQWYGSGTNPGSVVVGAPGVGFDAAYRNNRYNYPLSGEYSRNDLQALPGSNGGTYNVQHYEILPASFSQAYSDSMVQAIATYDRFEWSKNPSNPVQRTAAQTLSQNTLAVARADQYVWHYTDTYDYLVAPGVIYPGYNPTGLTSVAPSATTTDALRAARETGHRRANGVLLSCSAFEGTDSNSWTPDSGTWAVANTTRAGVATSAYVQSANNVWGVSALTGNSLAGGLQTLTNYTVTAAVRAENGNLTPWGEYGVGILGRYVDQNNFYGLVLKETVADGKGWALFARINGVNQWIAGGALNWTQGSWVHLQLQMNGNKLVARTSNDGIHFTTLTTSTNNKLSSGKVGLLGYMAKSSFDQVNINA